MNCEQEFRMMLTNAHAGDVERGWGEGRHGMERAGRGGAIATSIVKAPHPPVQTINYGTFRP